MIQHSCNLDVIKLSCLAGKGDSYSTYSYSQSHSHKRLRTGSDQLFKKPRWLPQYKVIIFYLEEAANMERE